MTEKPYEIPDKWVWTTVGEVCQKPQYGWTTKAASEGNIHLLRTTDITSGKVDWSTVPYCEEAPPDIGKYLLEEGDIVISRAGSVGYSHLVRRPEKACFASYLIRFKTFINGSYLSYFLQSPYYWSAISEEKMGIAIPNVNATKLSQIKLPLPPLAEQIRIISKLEEIFSKLGAAIDSLHSSKVQLKRYQQSVLKNAFEGKLTQEWQKEHVNELKPTFALLERREKKKSKEIASVDKSKLSELPDKWCWAFLSELGEVSRGKSTHRPRNDERLFGGNYPFIQTGDVRDSNGLITKYTQTYNEFGLKQSRLWPVNTLCITIAANIADTALLGIPACFPDSIVGFIASSGICNVKYVYFYFKMMKDRLESSAPATAQKNINLHILRKVILPLPPLPEQYKIVEMIEERFSVADAMEKAVEEGLTRSERLKQSVLKDAFEGKLVPQDSSDEPAFRLLERIRQEKNYHGQDMEQLRLEKW